jgi:hypothetical protein
MKNLYIISEVLFDYSGGIVIIIATNLDECRSLFAESFRASIYLKEFDEAIEGNYYKVIQVNDNEESRIVKYLHGNCR